MDTLLRRLVLAWTTVPGAQEWFRAALLLAVLTVLLLPVGLKTGFLRTGAPGLPMSRIAGVLLVSLVLPSLAEELLFRALLLPHPTENVSATARWLWGVSNVVAFVAYHPLNALRHAPAKRAVLTNPVFLGMAALLGAACVAAYFISGSLWPPVAIHWLVVVVWLLLLGGYRKLYPD